MQLPIRLESLRRIGLHWCVHANESTNNQAGGPLNRIHTYAHKLVLWLFMLTAHKNYSQKINKISFIASRKASQLGLEDGYVRFFKSADQVGKI
jgi:hypothetical protein